LVTLRCALNYDEEELFQCEPLLRGSILEGGGSSEAPSQGIFKEHTKYSK